VFVEDIFMYLVFSSLIINQILLLSSMYFLKKYIFLIPFNYAKVL